MAKYIVNCLHLSGKGKNMFKQDDPVTTDNFYEGQAEDYLKSGHLKEEEPAEEASESTESTESTEATEEATESTEEVAEEAAEETKKKAPKVKPSKK